MDNRPLVIARQWLWVIAAPTILTIGIAGNLVVLFVLLLTPGLRGRRGGSVGFALTALAVVDSLLLLTILPQRYHENMYGADNSISSWFCPLHQLLSHLLTQLSSWTVALMSVNRALVVSRQIPVASYGDREWRRFVLSWVSVVVLLMALNSHFLWTMKYVTNADFRNMTPYATTTSAHEFIDQSTAVPEFIPSLETDHHDFNRTIAAAVDSPKWSFCLQREDEYPTLFRLWKWIDLLVWAVVPFTVLLVANATIIVRIRLSDRHLSTVASILSAPASPLAASSLVVKLHPHFSGRASCSSMTRMLLFVSFSFLLSHLPLLICMMLALVDLNKILDTMFQLIVDVCKVISLIEYATHFVLYCVCGQRFRTAVMTLCGVS